MANSQWTELANQYGEHFGVPPALILSLIDMESGGNPNNVNPNSHATGLMQLTHVVVKDYNQRHNLKLTLEDVKDPGLNVKIGAELLKRIALTYEKFNGLPPKWDSRAYAGLIVQGWNAGYSRKSGVSYVLSRLAAQGIDKSRWSAALVHQAANRMSGAVRFLKEPRRLTWLGKVIDRYSGIEKGAERRQAQASTSPMSPGKKALIYTGVGVGVLGLGYMILSKESESPGGGLLGAAGAAAPIIIINRK